MDFRIIFHVLASLSLQASVSNLFDASYSYVEGYPAPGRQFFLGFRYDLNTSSTSGMQ
jgi:outer membrane cobalamin receptor